MDYATHRLNPCHGTADKIVFVSYCDDKEYQLQGFECETIFLMNENSRIREHAIMDDLDNYDGMDYPASDKRPTIEGKQPSRWRRFFNTMRPNRRRHNNSNFSSKRRENDYKDTSDCNTVATSSSISLDSQHGREGLPCVTSSKFVMDKETELNPRILDFVSRMIYGTQKIEVSLVHPANPIGDAGSDPLSDDCTACTEQSDVSTDSNRSDAVFTAPSLMEQRLLATGLVKRADFEFVPDYVSKEVLHLVEDLKTRNNHDHATNDGNVSHVKTGIWEVVCFDKDGQPKQPEYIVTGVSMDDRVDTKKLRKFVFSGEQQQHKRRPKLAMAPTEIAEELAGYKSGTMAPICHGHNMKLFLEESLIMDVDLRTHRLAVGSGTFGKCLSISAHHFLEIAKSNPEGVAICPIIRTTKVLKS